jgi:hypothetical protein
MLSDGALGQHSAVCWPVHIVRSTTLNPTRSDRHRQHEHSASRPTGPAAYEVSCNPYAMKMAEHDSVASTACCCPNAANSRTAKASPVRCPSRPSTSRRP